MTLLSDGEILAEMKRGAIKALPFVRGNLGPDSLDITLGDEVLIFKQSCDNAPIDPLKKDGLERCFESVRIDDRFILRKNQFVLANTTERISLSNNISAMLEGRSSLARFGIMVHMTGGVVHAGFGAKQPSTLTLEIYSVNPNDIILKPGMKIAQLSFFKLSSPASEGYDAKSGSKYVAQTSPVPPRIYLD
jgi:dCTP deaminase